MKSKIQAKDLRGNEPAELARTLRKLEEDLLPVSVEEEHEPAREHDAGAPHPAGHRAGEHGAGRAANKSTVAAPATPAKEK
jgi:hypothetical protein